jgi:hypothetical protein
MTAEVWRNTKQLFELEPRPAVEQLIYEVRATAFERWRAAEHELWTRALGDRFPAMLGKETWVQDLGEWYRISIVVYWRTLEDWLGIDAVWLEHQEVMFAERVGSDDYRLVQTGHDSGAHYFKLSEYR